MSSSTFSAVIRTSSNSGSVAGNLHENFANLGGDAASMTRFEKRWGQLLTKGKATRLQLDPERDGQLQILDPSYGVPWNHKLELQEKLRKAWRNDPESINFIHRSVTEHMTTRWDFSNKRIEIITDDLWSTICIIFLRDFAAGKIEICANLDGHCHSPFFLKKRSTQKYCDAGPCCLAAQRKYALDWWYRKGDKARATKHAKMRKGRKRR
jgi:hypothetical protein